MQSIPVALLSRLLRDCRLCEALLCQEQDGWEDQEVFVQGQMDTIVLCLKVLAARPHHETLHRLCNHCNFQRVEVSQSDYKIVQTCKWKGRGWCYY